MEISHSLLTLLVTEIFWSFVSQKYHNSPKHSSLVCIFRRSVTMTLSRKSVTEKNSC